MMGWMEGGERGGEREGMERERGEEVETEGGGWKREEGKQSEQKVELVVVLQE